jgi:microsomal dipeptidase-like Zn-dependent dipeptidase
MIIDVSHVSPKGRMDIYQLVEARWKNGAKRGQTREGCVIASHVGAQEFHHHPYNLADWEIKWIADHGGVVGIIFSTYWLSGQGEAKLGLGYIEKTIDHMVRTAGDHVVAFGSDFDGFSDPPDDLADFSEWHHLADYLKLMHVRSGDGELINERFIRGFVDYTSPSKGPSVPAFTTDIHRKYTTAQIEGFMWRNAFESIRRGWGKRS